MMTKVAEFRISRIRLRRASTALAFAAFGLVAAPWAEAQSLNVLHNFTGSLTETNSVSALIMDEAGNLYGTQAEGGASGVGTVFNSIPRVVIRTYTASLSTPSMGLIPTQR